MKLDITSIILQELEKYVSQFGSVDLDKDPNKPYYSCNLNQIPSIIFPILLIDGEPIGLEEIEKHFPVIKNSHQAIRLEIHISKEGIDTKVIFLNDYKRLNNI